MNRLYLMRHAQAESHGPAGDASRPLTPGGLADAREAGAALREAGVDLALVSTAERTRQTFEALGLNCRVEYMDVLYRGGTEEILQRIQEVDWDPALAVRRLLVVGHAPTIPSLAAELLYRTAPRQADQLQCHYPTGTITTLDVEGPWEELLDHPVHLAD